MCFLVLRHMFDAGDGSHFRETVESAGIFAGNERFYIFGELVALQQKIKTHAAPLQMPLMPEGIQPASAEGLRGFDLCSGHGGMNDSVFCFPALRKVSAERQRIRREWAVPELQALFAGYLIALGAFFVYNT